jgi:hypothetical protein
MEDLLILVLVLGALFLAFSVYLLITNRRTAEPPFVAELPVPPEVRAAVYGGKADEGGRGADDERPPTSDGAAPGSAGDVEPSNAGSSPDSHVPLVDALSGMDLPCGLTFLGTVEPEADALEVLVFVTEQHLPDEVEEAFHVELRRLGYELHPNGQEHSVLAQRGDVDFTTTVHHPAGTVLRGKVKAFPTAPLAAVVVELSRR